jgi:LAS superfamily LD-carboxypeptidase LdcB
MRAFLTLLAGFIGLAIVLGSREVLGYAGGKPFALQVDSIGNGQVMRRDAAAAFNAMRAAAAKAGIVLSVSYAYRSMEEQVRLYAKYLAGTGNLAAKPGFSNHQSGVAVDINVGGTSTAVYAWLAANAARFGFKRTVASESWHWEYAA